MTTKHGEIWWTELNTRDPEKARDFYTKVMGWTPLRCVDDRNGAARQAG